MSDKTYFPESDIEEQFCHLHSSAKGDFFCLTCLLFICKHCFVNNHKEHEAYVPSEVVSKLLQRVKDTSASLTTNLPLLIERLGSVQAINKNFNTIKEGLQKKCQNIKQNFNNEIKTSLDEKLRLILDESIGSITTDCESLTNKIIFFQNVVKKELEAADEVSGQIFKCDSNSIKICEYLVKEKNKILQMLNNDVEKKFVSIQSQIEVLSKSIETKRSEFEIIASTICKDLEIYEQLIESTISSGFSNIYYPIRRFLTFNSPDSKPCFFKKSALSFTPRSNITLLGIGVCGLFPNSAPINISIEIYRKVSSSPNDEHNLTQTDYALMQKETFQLSPILNSWDPVETFFLHTSIELEAQQPILILIENLSKEEYIKIFTGQAVNIEKFFNIQEIVCNSTQINFSFCRPKGQYSDFDELSLGIISDLFFIN